MNKSEWPVIPAVEPIAAKVAKVSAPEINPVDPEAVREFNGAMKHLKDYGREFDELDGEQEQRLAALWWLSRPKFDRFDWMDLFNHENNKRLLKLMAQGDDLALGRYLAGLIASYTTDDIREAYGEPETGPSPDDAGDRMRDKELAA